LSRHVTRDIRDLSRLFALTLALLPDPRLFAHFQAALFVLVRNLAHGGGDHLGGCAGLRHDFHDVCYLAAAHAGSPVR